MIRISPPRGVVAGAVLAAVMATAAPIRAETMVVGVDTKFTFDDAGKRVFRPNTGDAVLFYDLADPARPALIGNLPLVNSVVGPPTNLAVTPNGKLALIASSLTTEPAGDGTFKPVPDDRVFVVDLTAKPPRLIATVKVGAQPSGLGISPDGSMALVANRVGKSVSVLTIAGDEVRVADTVPMGDVVTSVSFTPDGRRALVSKFAVHKIAVLNVADGTVRPAGRDMLVGQYPYTVTVTADGRFGLAASDGDQAGSTGDTDPVAVIDLAAQPPRVTDYVAVGDAVEGVVASPRGDYAAATILQGSLDAPKGSWYRHDTGRVALLRLTGGKVSLADSIDVGAFPEGIAFSRDGDWIYAGNFASNTISVLHIEGGRLVDTHRDITLPGPPASLRVGSQ
jgi:DNA-binding beta-propeller fold protein YncE